MEMFVCFDSLCPSQHFFNHVGMRLPGLNQSYAEDTMEMEIYRLYSAILRETFPFRKGYLLSGRHFKEHVCLKGQIGTCESQLGNGVNW